MTDAGRGIGRALIGVDRHDCGTWDQRAAHHLQHLKGHPAFARIGTARTLGAIADLISTSHRPSDWGAFFLLFPSSRRWTVPWQAWHVDHPSKAPVEPLRGLKVHAVFGRIEPRAGGMTVVAGSHHLVGAASVADPPPPRERRRRVPDPPLRALGTDPLLLHTRPTNAGTEPRFLLKKDLRALIVPLASRTFINPDDGRARHAGRNDDDMINVPGLADA